MIEAMVGLPGGGKSFFAVQRSLQYMAAGGSVFTNIRFTGTEQTENGTGIDRYRLSDDSPVRRVLRKNYGWQYIEGQYHYIDLETLDNTDLLSTVPRGSKEKPILLILDEVNEWFDSLDTGRLKGKDEKYRELFKFLRLSRHYHIDVLFLLQDFPTLNVRLRGLCQHVFRSFDLSKVKLPALPIHGPNWFLWQMFDKSSKTLLKSWTWPKEQAVFSCYDSYCEFGAVPLCKDDFNSDFSKRKNDKTEVNKMTRSDRIMVYGMLFACLCLSGFAWRDRRTSGGLEPRVVVVTNQVVTATAPPSPSLESSVSVSPASRRPAVVVRYEPFVYGCDGVFDGVAREWVLASGRKYRPRQKTPEGFVVDLNRDFVRMVGDDGCETFIYPLVIEGQFTSGGKDD